MFICFAIKVLIIYVGYTARVYKSIYLLLCLLNMYAFTLFQPMQSIIVLYVSYN